jgi:hypothetical protein
MSVWEHVRRTGQREAKVFVFREIPQEGGDHAGAGQALVPERDYFRVWLCEMFLGKRSTLLADWLPAAHARVSMTRSGGPPVESCKVLRPDPAHLAQGVRLNYQLTDLIPYNGGVVEVEAALVAWQQTNRVDAALDVLQTISALPIPSLAPALTVAQQVTSAAQRLVQNADGAVHLDFHQSFVASHGDGQHPQPGSVLRPMYLAVLLADESQVSPGTLRVIDNRLHQVGPDGAVEHLRGWDFLLLGIEGRSVLDDFWLPELEDLLNSAVQALLAGQPAIATYYRDAAVAVAWRSPMFNWADRDRIIDAIKGRFDHVAQRGLGATAARRPVSLTEIVHQHGPSIAEVRARGRMTEASAFAHK